MIRIFKYLIARFIRTLLMFTEGYRLRDKVFLLPYGFFQALVGALGLLRLTQFRGWGKIYRITIPPFGLMLKNRYGLFYCRGGDDLPILYEGFELDTTKYIYTYLHRQGGVFVDIGSHAGRYTIMAGR
ncbi:hypothetical protein ACFLXO_06855 [Chloroflexota bacterium]